MGRNLFDRAILLLALAALLGLGAWSVYAGPHSARALQAGLEREARYALDALGYGWAKVSVDGQVARLSGEAPTPEARDKAVLAVIGAAPPVWAEQLPSALRPPEKTGGPVWGGITQVVSEITLAAIVSPYTWHAELVPGQGLSMSGHVPDADTRTYLFAAAERHFLGRVSAELDLAEGVPDDHWAAMIETTLMALSVLEEGSVMAQDRAVALIGRAATPEAEAAAREALAQLPEGYAINFEISVGTADAADGTDPAPAPAQEE